MTIGLDPITAVANTVSGIINKIWPDANEREKAKLAQVQAEINLAIGQMEINKAEASHQSIFVAGWRPFIGWVCGSALAWNFIAFPFISWYVEIPLPALDSGELMTILLGMLGLGAFRTYEKMKGNGKVG